MDNNNDIDILSTEGIAWEELKNFDQVDGFNGLTECHYCQLYYKSDMFVPNEIDDESDICCWHCFFRDNYDLELRNKIAKEHNMPENKYIEKCAGNHKKNMYKDCNPSNCILCKHDK